MRESPRDKFDDQEQTTMTITEHETRLYALARQSLMSITTKEDRVRKFVKGLITPLHLCIEHLVTTCATFQ